MRIFRYFLLLIWLVPALYAKDLHQVAMIDLPGEPGFESIAIANGSLVVAHGAANTVDIFDLAKRHMIAQVKNVHDASGIAVDDREHRVFISSPATQSVIVISSDTWNVQDVIPVKVAIDQVLYVPENGRLYLADSHSQAIGYLDVGHGNAVHMQDAGGLPERLAYDPARHHLYASLQDQHAIGVYDLELKPIAQWVLKGSQPTGLAVDSAAQKLYVAVRYAVIALNAETGAEINRVGAPAGVDSLWLDRQQATLFAASGGAVDIMRTTPNGLTLQSELPVEVRGHTLAYDAQSGLLYFPGGRDGRSKLLILKQVQGQAPVLAGKSPAQATAGQ